MSEKHPFESNPDRASEVSERNKSLFYERVKQLVLGRPGRKLFDPDDTDRSFKIGKEKIFISYQGLPLEKSEKATPLQKMSPSELVAHIVAGARASVEIFTRESKDWGRFRSYFLGFDETLHLFTGTVDLKRQRERRDLGEESRRIGSDEMQAIALHDAIEELASHEARSAGAYEMGFTIPSDEEVARVNERLEQLVARDETRKKKS